MQGARKVAMRARRACFLGECRTHQAAARTAQLLIGGRAKQVAIGRLRSIVETVAYFLAGFEIGHALGRHIDRRPSARIAACARLALAS